MAIGEDKVPHLPRRVREDAGAVLPEPYGTHVREYLRTLSDHDRVRGAHELSVPERWAGLRVVGGVEGGGTTVHPIGNRHPLAGLHLPTFGIHPGFQWV